MKFMYTPNKIDIIEEHEKNMLEEYSRIINSYSDIFAQYGCTLKVGFVWNNCLKKHTSTTRLPFQNGYLCYVCCDIFKAGKIFSYNTNDEEADYYEASTFWNITSITKFFFKLSVTLYTEMNDIHKEMNRLFKIIQEHTEKCTDQSKTNQSGDGSVIDDSSKKCTGDGSLCSSD